MSQPTQLTVHFKCGHKEVTTLDSTRSSQQNRNLWTRVKTWYPSPPTETKHQQSGHLCTRCREIRTKQINSAAETQAHMAANAARILAVRPCLPAPPPRAQSATIAAVALPGDEAAISVLQNLQLSAARESQKRTNNNVEQERTSFSAQRDLDIVSKFWDNFHSEHDGRVHEVKSLSGPGFCTECKKMEISLTDPRYRRQGGQLPDVKLSNGIWYGAVGTGENSKSLDAALKGLDENPNKLLRSDDIPADVADSRQREALDDPVASSTSKPQIAKCGENGDDGGEESHNIHPTTTSSEVLNEAELTVLPLVIKKKEATSPSLADNLPQQIETTNPPIKKKGKEKIVEKEDMAPAQRFTTLAESYITDATDSSRPKTSRGPAPEETDWTAMNTRNPAEEHPNAWAFPSERAKWKKGQEPAYFQPLARELHRLDVSVRLRNLPSLPPQDDIEVQSLNSESSHGLWQPKNVSIPSSSTVKRPSDMLVGLWRLAEESELSSPSPLVIMETEQPLSAAAAEPVQPSQEDSIDEPLPELPPLPPQDEAELDTLHFGECPPWFSERFLACPIERISDSKTLGWEEMAEGYILQATTYLPQASDFPPYRRFNFACPDLPPIRNPSSLLGQHSIQMIRSHLCLPSHISPHDLWNYLYTKKHVLNGMWNTDILASTTPDLWLHRDMAIVRRNRLILSLINRMQWPESDEDPESDVDSWERSSTSGNVSDDSEEGEDSDHECAREAFKSELRGRFYAQNVKSQSNLLEGFEPPSPLDAVEDSDQPSHPHISAELVLHKPPQGEWFEEDNSAFPYNTEQEDAQSLSDNWEAELFARLSTPTPNSLVKQITSQSIRSTLDEGVADEVRWVWISATVAQDSKLSYKMKKRSGLRDKLVLCEDLKNDDFYCRFD